MDMRGSPRIRNRPDREELIPAGQIGDRRPVSLEILVARLIGPTIPDIMVAAIGVALPNLDPCSRNGLSIAIENASGDPCDAALSRPLVPGDVDEIAVGVLRKALRVERAGCLPWGRRQRRRGTRRYSEQRRRSRERERTPDEP